ncbi:MAG: adenylate/guanylate cyclase domain-containing protein [Pseudomonadota bacterium]
MIASRFRWLSAFPLILVTAILFILAVTVLTYSQARQGGPREQLFDFYQRLAPAPVEDTSPFHIVSIDSQTIETAGPWPWPRSLVADVIRSAEAAGAKAVIFTEPVDTPDPLSPETIGSFWLSGARDSVLGEQLALLPSTDQLLADAIARVDGAVTIDPGSSAAYAEALSLAQVDPLTSEWADLDEEASSRFFAAPPARPRHSMPDSIRGGIPLTVRALPLDSDGILRTIPLTWSLDGEPVPSIALEAAKLASDNRSVVFKQSGASVSPVGATIGQLTFGDITIPTDSQIRTRLYLPKQLEIPTTPARRLLSGQGSNSQLNGKIVFVGLDAETGETIKTPRGFLSKTQAHALGAQQVLNGTFSHRPGWVGYVEALSVLLFGAAAIMWSRRFDFWKAVGIACIASLFVFGLSIIAFSASRTLIDPLPVGFALFIGAFSVAGGRSIGAVLSDDNVRGNFQGALPEPAMQRLRDEGASQVLNGHRREVTVLACELRLVDEDLDRLASTPDRVTTLLASASAQLRKTIADVGGAVDQADGGKIYGYFNAPLEAADHVRAACSGALRLVESMDKINSELDASASARGVQIHLAIGIASGECFVGPMGHGRSNRYSAVGPAVELAGFLRRQAEIYGPAIICDDTVYKQTHHHFAYLELDRLKSSEEGRPFSVFALVGNPFIKSSKGYRALEEAHRQLLTSYREGEFTAARNHLETAKKSPGAKIALFDIYEERINRMLAKEKPDNWDGSVRVTI